MAATVASLTNNAKLGVAFIVVGMFCITLNDAIIKQLSGGYPLHQMIFVRSAIGIVFSFAILRFEGGIGALRTRRIGLHVTRALLLVVANMAFFAALAVMPLADATALFFVAPLFITLLSIPVLGEKVGVRRLSAVLLGFLGVVVMLRPGVGLSEAMPERWVLLFPIVAALTYAGMQVLTRQLGGDATASAMAIHNQVAFLGVSLIFWIVAGDGRYAAGLEDQSARFLLRAWTWPPRDDWGWFLLLGLLSAFIGYSLAQAYRSANAATIAPFEYVALPMAIFWGWLVFDQLPDLWVSIGILLIAASGIYVFLREGRKSGPVGDRPPAR